MLGLIVNSLNEEGIPYAELIVSGEKTWEMKKTSTNVRGRIGILYHDKLLGMANIVDADGPYTVSELAGYYSNHRVSQSKLEIYSQGKKLHAWILKDAERFEKPERIKRKRGQVIWVKIN